MFRVGVFVLNLLKKTRSPLLQLLETSISAKCCEQAADVFVWPPQIYLDSILAHKLVGVLPAKIVLNDSIANDHVAEYDLAVITKRHTASHANK
jgi:hypothetical protein